MPEPRGRIKRRPDHQLVAEQLDIARRLAQGASEQV